MNTETAGVLLTIASTRKLKHLRDLLKDLSSKAIQFILEFLLNYPDFAVSAAERLIVKKYRKVFRTLSKRAFNDRKAKQFIVKHYRLVRKIAQKYLITVGKEA